MARALICDVCKNPTDEIVEKLLITPTPRHGMSMHSNYTHHADVGKCCTGRIKNIINFKPRKTRKEYNAERRKRAGRGMGKEVERVGDSVASRKAS